MMHICDSSFLSHALMNLSNVLPFIYLSFCDLAQLFNSFYKSVDFCFEYLNKQGCLISLIHRRTVMTSVWSKKSFEIEHISGYSLCQHLWLFFLLKFVLHM